MSSNNFCIVGSTASGKTTYLAALAYHQEHRIQNNQKSSYTVEAIGRDTENLKKKAEVLLTKGLRLEPTRIQKVDQLPVYQFTIEGKAGWRSPKERFDITTRDYPGEAFHYLVEEELPNDTKYDEDFLKDCVKGLIEDCFNDSKGCVMMLPGWELHQEDGGDDFYTAILERFIEQMDSANQKDTYKMAVVMSKCERGEIWTGRLEPERDLFEVYLPETTRYLRKNLKPENLRFFALSTFGVRDRADPRPNRKDVIRPKGKESVTESVLFNTGKGQWQPYNLLEPLYWLINS